MTRPLEITLKSSFITFTRAYVESFPRSFIAYGGNPDDFNEALHAYSEVIYHNVDAIYTIAAREIHSYLNLYNIHANKSADEYKIIYFLGRAIDKHLQANGLADVSMVHMYSMIGLLDFRIQDLGYKKPLLTKALTRLVKLGRFDEQLGLNGCYLIYKCVSTATREAA